MFWILKMMFMLSNRIILRPQSNQKRFTNINLKFLLWKILLRKLAKKAF